MKTKQDLIVKLISSAMDNLGRYAEEESKNYSFRKDGTSPLEEVIGTGFLTWVYLHNFNALMRNRPLVAEFCDVPYCDFEFLKKDKPKFFLTIWPQAKIGQFRCDFLLRVGAENCSLIWIAVECDGHDFHERTKEQAERDRARDRYFQSEGLQIFRFTGSEIWRDPEDVLFEIMDFINKKAGF